MQTHGNRYNVVQFPMERVRAAAKRKLLSKALTLSFYDFVALIADEASKDRLTSDEAADLMDQYLTERDENEK